MINKANTALIELCSKNEFHKKLNNIRIEENRTVAGDGNILGIVTMPKIDENFPRYQAAFKGQGKMLSVNIFSVKYLKKIIKLCDALGTDEIKIKMYSDSIICLANNKKSGQKLILKLMCLEDRA